METGTWNVKHGFSVGEEAVLIVQLYSLKGMVLFIHLEDKKINITRDNCFDED